MTTVASTELNPIRALLERPVSSGGVLSVYLNTTISRVADKSYILACRDGCKAIRSGLPEKDHTEFEAAVAQIEHYLLNTSLTDPGIAIFASGTPASFATFPLSTAPHDMVIWGPRPYVRYLVADHARAERFAVVLVDTMRTRLLTVASGTIEEFMNFDDYVQPHHRSGGWAALEQSRAARHRTKHALDHLQRTVKALEAMADVRPFGYLLVGGPDRPVTQFCDALPPSLHQRLSGRLHIEVFAGTADIHQKAQAAFDEFRDERDDVLVERLLSGNESASMSIGLDSTLAALSDNRVARLVIANPATAPGAECPNCGYLTRQKGACPRCGALQTDVSDIYERATERALVQWTDIQAVSGIPAVRLMSCEGIAATLRF